MPEEVRIQAEPAVITGVASQNADEPAGHVLIPGLGPVKNSTQFYVGRCSGCGWSMSWVEDPDEINAGHSQHLAETFGDSDSDVSTEEDSDG